MQKQQDYEVKLAKGPEGAGKLPGWARWSTTPGPTSCTARSAGSGSRAGSRVRPELRRLGQEADQFLTITVGSVGLSGEFIVAFAGEGSGPASLDELLRRLDRGDFDLVTMAGRPCCRTRTEKVRAADVGIEELRTRGAGDAVLGRRRSIAPPLGAVGRRPTEGDCGLSRPLRLGALRRSTSPVGEDLLGR